MLGKPSQAVKINCRRCGQPCESDKFILDPVYKMMVCPKCVQERKSQAFLKKPAGSNAVPPAQAQLSAASQARASSKSVSASEYRAAVEARIAPSTQKPKEPEAPKPAGWDEDDLELERLAKAKANQAAPKVERISDDKLKMTCAKCKYRFTYSISTQTPTSCPYCGREVEKPRSY